MKVVCFIEPTIGENCYILYDEETNEGVIVDPGGDDGRIVKFIKDNHIKIMSILLTHGHFDHIGSVDKIVKLSNAPVAAHEDEIAVLGDASINFSRAMSGTAIEIQPDVLLNENSKISFGKNTIRTIHTPGHTPGGVCYYCEEEKILFTGDTLFYESVGRTDFPLGSTKALYESIREKLFTLPDDVICYPGHGEETSIGYEKRNNRFL